jgi:hypothetical protein
MSILIRPKKVDSPLSQGDILKDVSLHFTDANWEGVSARERTTCMVISRPCACAHLGYVVVAEVAPVKITVPEEVKKSFDKLVWFFEKQLRDGSESPDRFFLGDLPDSKSGYFAAYLNSLHTLNLPCPTELEDFLKKKRIAQLDADFVRDLHFRIFRAFGLLGFDDHSWLPDSNLEWVVNAGHQELGSLKSKVLDAQSAIHAAAAEEGGGVKEKKLQGMRLQITNAERELDEFQRKFAPYEAEHLRRKAADTQKPSEDRER